VNPASPPSRLQPRRLAAAWALALAGLALGPAAPPLGADAATVRRAKEYDLKATFLFHFTRFVAWPDRAFGSPEAPFTLCVLSPDPFGNALRDVVAGERAAGRELRLRTVGSASDARGCQIVFVPQQRDSTVLRYLPGATDGLVLTVGEADDFLDRGGIVRFELREGRIRLLVSRRALGDSELQMSSKLLALAHLE
jgi:hypothetical protein